MRSFKQEFQENARINPGILREHVESFRNDVNNVFCTDYMYLHAVIPKAIKMAERYIAELRIAAKRLEEDPGQQDAAFMQKELDRKYGYLDSED
jgi:hypothetical protein